ncbi:hypothetical protein [Streptomyces beihaiensis]|uniref:Uncharacterized protein n=1 Tax=Streptomyces beihaiensis TaxID=2984495 RepID=A0ABT3TTZ8_9ACTN|nr:hypothetical protein [Streptomyces beihaiensis]MCX3059922.1 hypothetical protein [Streptomyces beihaiensis]
MPCAEPRRGRHPFACAVIAPAVLVAGAAASGGRSGTDPALKNGRLRRSTTGPWDVNSAGRITVGGRRHLVAVVSRGSRTTGSGSSRTW